MKLDGLNLHLENLIPGIVILGSLIILLSPLSSSMQKATIIDELMKSEFLISTFFISCAYILGLLSAVLARFFVDFTSELLPRPLLLRLLSHKTYDELRFALPSLPIKGKNWRYLWNMVYRASLKYTTSECSKEIAMEVMRLREQGRFIRNLFFPLLIGTGALSRLFQINNGWIIAIINAIITILLYAYAEYTTFAEASLHLPESSDKQSNIVVEKK
ncbi:MAG: hypothetical protein GYA36_22430 [Veillonellaceae bacterium]|nr:hypothetical protein [Veillonellaceae bacterium]